VTALVQERCVACRKDSPRVTDAEIAELQPQIPAWTRCDLLTFRDGKIAIKNSYRKNRPPLGIAPR
jgi:hypothetical protein